MPKWGGKIPPNLKLPLRDGDVDRPEDPAYADSYFINATSQEQPGVVDRKRVKITDPLAIYSGCYIRASINIYPFNAVEKLVKQAGGNVVGKMAILAEGAAQDRPDILYLEKLPLFNPDGTIKQG